MHARTHNTQIGGIKILAKNQATKCYQFKMRRGDARHAGHEQQNFNYNNRSPQTSQLLYNCIVHFAVSQSHFNTIVCSSTKQLAKAQLEQRLWQRLPELCLLTQSEGNMPRDSSSSKVKGSEEPRLQICTKQMCQGS